MPEILFAHQWTIAENQLLPLKDSINGRLRSSSIFCSAPVSNIPEFEYYLQISPNGDEDECRGETYIFLFLDFINVKMVEADYTYTIESANYSKECSHIYENSKGRGPCICKVDDFFDPEKRFIVDGNFTVKINGIFKYEIEIAYPVFIRELKWEGGELGNQLWENDDMKDFTIICEGEKQIKVHNFILLSRSEFFKEMLNSCSTDSSVEITDFAFTVVETALKIIYNCNFTTFLSINELMELLQFFDKYLFSTFKAKVEQLLIRQISATTVVRLTNCSVKTNSPKLKEKCMEFLMASFQSKTPLPDIEILDKNIALQILQNLIQSSNTTIDSEQQKWIGAELGDELWEKNDTKDLIIKTKNGEKIKIHKLVIDTRSPTLFELFKMKEANENEVEIIDFSFDVVETAIKLIYHCNFISALSMDELMELLQFFSTYNLATLKEKVEPYLIAQISATTICKLTNCSIQTDSPKLKEKCMEFLMNAFQSKIALTDIDDLDINIKSKLLKDSLYQILETDKK